MDRKRKIKILAHYNASESGQNRYKAPSACTKLEYIMDAISNNDMEIEVISASNSIDVSYPFKRISVTDRITLILLKALKRGGWLVNKFSTIFFHINLLFYLIFNIKKDDVLLVYHSLILMRMVYLVKKIKRCKLILEIEEIFQAKN